MRTTYLYITLIALCLSSLLQAAPRLSVVVMVDGLRQDNLQRLQPYLRAGGLRLLAEQAEKATVSFDNEVYGGCETVATLLTGEQPYIHGIAMDSCFSRSDRLIHPVLEDKAETPISATGPLSPRALLAPAIADRFRFRYGENAHIYAVGQTPATTILMAGHAADGCCWLDPMTEQWGTTSFYPAGLPAVADECNVSGRIQRAIDQEWMPRMDFPLYMSPTDNEQKKNGFHYRTHEPLHYTPAINTLIVEMTLQLRETFVLGGDDTPDLLLVQMTTRTPKAKSDYIASAEQEDMYLALNQDLGFLIEQLQRAVGKENVDFFVVGVPRQGISLQTLAASRMPVKTFYTDQASALTSAYLMALYGQGQWVIGGYGTSLYLNRPLIEQKQMSLPTVQQQVADFLMDFEGVRIAQPQHLAYLDPTIAATVSKKNAGDVIFHLQAGWQLAYNEQQAIDKVMEQQPTVPLLYLTHSHTLSLPDQTAEATEIAGWILQLIDKH